MSIRRVRRVLAYLAVVAVLALANYFGWRDWQRTHGPAVPLTAAINAIADRDSTTFEQVVDVDRLVGSYYDQHLIRGAPVDEKVREAAIRAIRRRLRHWIDAGTVEPSSPHFDALLAFLRDSVARSPQIGQPQPHGRSRTSTVVLRNSLGDTATLLLKIVQSDGRWKVAELLDAEEMVAQVRKAEEHRFARDVAAIVTISPPREQSSMWESVVVSKTDQPIEQVICTVMAAGATRTLPAVDSPLPGRATRQFRFDLADCGAPACTPAVTIVRLVAGGHELAPLPLD